MAEATQVVGILLVFALMVGPAAASQRLSSRFRTALALSVVFALAQTWLGIALAYETDWPPSFWITFLSFVTYAASVAVTHAWRCGVPIVEKTRISRSSRPWRSAGHRGVGVFPVRRAT